jgi:hypothetical protein
MGGFIIRKWFPRRSIEYIQLPGETHTIPVPQLTQVIERRFEWRTDTVPGQTPPPDTVYVAEPTQVACAEAAYPVRYHVTNLDAPQEYYFEDPEARTALSIERLGLEGGVFTRQQKLLTYPNLGPIMAIRTRGDAIRVDFWKPPVPPKTCDFWCQMGKMGIGVAIGFPAGALTCAAIR